MNKRKILIALSDDDFHSGSSLSAAYLANELNHLDFEVTVLVPKGKRSIGLLDKLNVKYIVTRYYSWTKKLDEPAYMKLVRKARQEFRNFYNKTFGSIKVAKIIEDGAYDLVALNNTWVYVPAQVSLNLGIPFVWHLREFNEEDHGWTFCYRDKALALIRESNAIIGVSDAIVNKYAPLIESENIYKVSNGIDPAIFSKIESRPFSDRMLRIGIIGRISKGKGQVDLIKAVSFIKDEIGEFEIHIAGKGSSADEAFLKKAISDSDMNERVVLHGEVDDVAGFYESIDILVVSSKMEAFGRVAVEGLMAQRVVIASDSGGLPEVIIDEETGYLFEGGDASALSGKIIEVLNDKGHALKIAEQGRALALSNFTAEANAHRLSKIYDTVLTGRDQ